jgi:hypothetical protein
LHVMLESNESLNPESEQINEKKERKRKSAHKSSAYFET